MKISKLIELSNQKRVAEEYAKSSEWNDDVRIYAIERIFEKPILFDIIETASEDFIREACLKKMYDFDYFFRMASSDANWRDRLIVISTLAGILSLRGDSTLMDCRDEILDNETYREYPARNDLKSIALNDGDWKNRLVATLIIDDDSILEDIVRNDESKHVRIAALFKIDNEDKLLEIIDNDSEDDVIDMACKRLDDESRLMESYFRYRKNAVIRNIHDQLFLIDRIYGSTDWDYCLEISNNIYDSQVLYDIMVGEEFQSKYQPMRRFISFPDDYVYFGDVMSNAFSLMNDDELQRKIALANPGYMSYAIEEIGDPEIYRELLNTLDYTFLPYTLRDKLVDDDTLANMALNHPSENVRNWAVTRIFDKPLLRQIIDRESDEKVKERALWNLNLDDSEFRLDTKYRFVCGEVVKKIRDEEKLVKIICYFYDEYISQIALNNITDDELLADFVCERPLGISKLAINKISDERLLAKIAINASEEFDAAYAVTKMTDDALLLDVLNNSPYPRCYPACVSRIGDDEIIYDIAYNFEDDYLRKVAVSRIVSQDILKDFALNDSNFHVRQQAVKNITDEAFLSQIIENDDNHSVRWAAEKAIEELKSDGNVKEL